MSEGEEVFLAVWVVSAILNAAYGVALRVRYGDSRDDAAFGLNLAGAIGCGILGPMGLVALVWAHVRYRKEVA